MNISASNDSLVPPTNHVSQSFNSSFLFGNKSSSTIFEKSTSNTTPLFGTKPIFGSFSTDSIKTDDTKSTSLFGFSSTTTPNSSIFGTFSASGSTESQNTNQSSLFSKTDDTKSKNDSLFSFSPKTDSPFKFGTVGPKDPKSVFGQNLFGIKDKPVVENGTYGIYLYILFDIVYDNNYFIIYSQSMGK